MRNKKIWVNEASFFIANRKMSDYHTQSSILHTLNPFSITEIYSNITEEQLSCLKWST